MPGSLIRTLLAAAFAVSCLAAARPTTPSLQPLTEEAREAALAPLPGITFRRPLPVPQRSNKRTAQDRFKKTTKYSHLHHYPDQLPGQRSVTRRLGAAAGGHHANITSANAFGTQYGINVTFGHQGLLLDLDTGSSDTWAFSAGTNCTDPPVGLVMAPPRHCGLGPRYGGNFTYGPIPGEHMYVQYGDGETVEGDLGYVDVTVGGVLVRNQTVGLAGKTVWRGNNVSSGVLGMAYPGLTNAFYGPEGHEGPFSSVQYSPVFSSMVGQGLVEDFFSIAIDRPGGDASSGKIGFGGVPEGIDGVDYDTIGQTDIIVANVAGNKHTASDYSFYTIIPDGWYYGSSTDDKKIPFIVDTGTTLIYLPTALAQAINSMFYPPAVYSFMDGGYLTTCDAVTPRVAVVIDGTPFYLNPKDLIFRSMPNDITGLCMTAFNDGSAGPFVLGDVFLKNVLAVFDIGENVLQLASRVHY